MAVKNDSSIWIGTMGRGLYKAQKDANDSVRIERQDLGDINNSMSIHQMIVEGNVLLFSTENNEVFAYSPSFIEPLNRIAPGKGRTRPVSMTQLITMAKDRQGRVWLGSDKGLFYINPPDYKSIEEYAFPEGINPDHATRVNCIFADRYKNIWVGTDQGVMNLSEDANTYPFGKKVLTSVEPGCDQCNDVLSFVKDDHDNLWVGTDGNGLFIFDENGRLIRRFSSENDFPDNNIPALYIDKQSNLWVGTSKHGIVLFDLSTNKFTRLQDIARKQDEDAYYGITDFAEDNSGDLWVATLGGGLFKIDPKSDNLINYRKRGDNKMNIRSDFVSKLFEDQSGTLWVGTWEGLSAYDRTNDLFTSYQTDRMDSSSISSNLVYTIAEDNEHHIWIGTGSGLNEFIPGGRFKRYYSEQGLPGNQIDCIQTDPKGYLWISTDEGLSRFDTKDRKFVNFRQEEGLQGKRFIHGSSYRDSKGMLYFGGINGFNRFYPDSILINSYIPNIILTKFKVNNTEVLPGTKGSPLTKFVNLTREVWLNHDQNSFSVEFFAQNYIPSSHNHFACKLEGFDKTWSYRNTNYPATYTNLDPGKYVFHVIGCNDFGFWNGQGKTLVIHIRPAWWSAWWMKAAILVSVLIFLFIIRRFMVIKITLKNKHWLDDERSQRSEELNRMKIQFFTNITHELRTPLSLIMGPLERISRNDGNSEELKIVQRNVSRLRNLVDQLLDFRRIESEDLPLKYSLVEVVGFVRDVVWNFKDLIAQKDINLIFRSVVSAFHIQLDEDKTYKILSNLLSNAVKFTPGGGTIEISLSQEQDQQDNAGYFAIRVSDSGKGISEPEKKRIFDLFYSTGYSARITGSTGIGLYLARKLTEMQNGKLLVDSFPETGTRFTVLLPLRDQRLNNSDDRNLNIEMVNKSFPDIQDSESVIYADNVNSRIVMVVDDDVEICSYLVHLLSSEFVVIKESDCKKAMETLMRRMPDLLISDVMMTEMNGIELCRKIKTDIRLRHIPVMLIRGRANDSDHLSGFDTDADEYIYKPFDDDILVSKIRNLIGQKDQLRTYFLGDLNRPESRSGFNRLDTIFIDQVMNIIRENYQNTSFNVNFIVEKMGMSRSVFYKRIKAMSTESINDLIKYFRLKRAGELLLTDRLTVSETAYNTGFSDPAYFSKVFKEHYKVSPKDFASTPNLQTLN